MPFSCFYVPRLGSCLSRERRLQRSQVVAMAQSKESVYSHWFMEIWDIYDRAVYIFKMIPAGPASMMPRQLQKQIPRCHRCEEMPNQGQSTHKEHQAQRLPQKFWREAMAFQLTADASARMGEFGLHHQNHITYNRQNRTINHNSALVDGTELPDHLDDRNFH